MMYFVTCVVVITFDVMCFLYLLLLLHLIPVLQRGDRNLNCCDIRSVICAPKMLAGLETFSGLPSLGFLFRTLQ